MAPEVLTSSSYDEKIDIYSAAVTFYELLEQTSFDVANPFAWATTPSKLAVLIKVMGSPEPTKRPPALELIDLFLGTKLAGVDTRAELMGKSSCCVVS